MFGVYSGSVPLRAVGVAPPPVVVGNLGDGRSSDGGCRGISVKATFAAAALNPVMVSELGL